VVLYWHVRIDISRWHDPQPTLVIVVLIHGIHILFFSLFLLLIILYLLGLIIRTGFLVLSQLKLTLMGLILNIFIAASTGVTSKIRCNLHSFELELNEASISSH
jgi:hypothetical protein